MLNEVSMILWLKACDNVKLQKILGKYAHETPIFNRENLEEK